MKIPRCEIKRILAAGRIREMNREQKTKSEVCGNRDVTEDENSEGLGTSRRTLWPLAAVVSPPCVAVPLLH